MRVSQKQDVQVKNILLLYITCFVWIGVTLLFWYANASKADVVDINPFIEWNNMKCQYRILHVNTLALVKSCWLYNLDF